MVDIFRKKDRETWTAIKKILSENGRVRFKSGHFFQDDLISGGCGARLDPRDFGPRGKIDRNIYWIKVPAVEADKARKILVDAGITI